jgi:hypothetical protein
VSDVTTDTIDNDGLSEDKTECVERSGDCEHGMDDRGKRKV